jgi:hypothetical protein
MRAQEGVVPTAIEDDENVMIADAAISVFTGGHLETV